MYQDIESFMCKDRAERRMHLKLHMKCIEIGGQNSGEFRGLLAHHLKTTIPTGRAILLCHACNNARCSNPSHLYWGTPTDNHLDLKESGGYQTFKEKTINKIGEAAYQELMRAASSKGGRAPKMKLSTERLAEINSVVDALPKVWGWKARAAKMLGVTHTQFNRYLKRI